MNIAYEYHYVGLIFTNRLSCDACVDNIVKIASSNLGFLRRSLEAAPPSLKLNAYKATVHSRLEYWDIIWNPLNDNNVKKLKRIPRKAVHFIYKRYSMHDSLNFVSGHIFFL